MVHKCKITPATSPLFWNTMYRRKLWSVLVLVSNYISDELDVVSDFIRINGYTHYTQYTVIIGNISSHWG